MERNDIKIWLILISVRGDEKEFSLRQKDIEACFQQKFFLGGEAVALAKNI